LLSTNGGSRGRHPSRNAVARILARADRPTLWFNYRMLVMARFGRPTVRLAWDMEAVYPPPAANGIAMQVEAGGRVQQVSPRP
jgi:hypothetical protein